MFRRLLYLVNIIHAAIYIQNTNSMSTRIYTSLLIAFLFLSQSILSQTAEIDSLWRVYKSSPIDTVKINALGDIAWKLKYNNPDSCRLVALKMLALAKEVKFHKGISAAYGTIGVSWFLKNEFDSALTYYNLAYDVRRKMKDYLGMAKISNNTGVLLKKKGDLEKAGAYYKLALGAAIKAQDKKFMATVFDNMAIIESERGNLNLAIGLHFKALRLREEVKDRDGINASFGNIAIIFNTKGDYRKSLEYNLKALKLREELQETSGIALAYNSIANNYFNMKMVDSAIYFYEKSISLNKSENLDVENITAYSNLGIIYESLLNYSKAAYYNKMALEKARLAQDLRLMAIASNNLASTYLKERKFADAQSLSLKAIEYNKQLDSKLILSTSYKLLKEVNYEKGDYKTAYKYSGLEAELRDSIYSETSSKQIAEINTKYETGRKLLEIERLNNEKKVAELVLDKTKIELDKQNTQKMAFALGLGLMLILTLVVLYSLRQKQIANKIISQQKLEVEQQKQIVDKAYEQLHEKNKEIMDSIIYARRIQRALITSEKYIKKELNRLASS